MRIKLAGAVAVIVFAFAFANSTYAQLGGASAAGGAKDARVERILKQLKYHYEITSDSDFKVPTDLDDGRTQTVYVNSSTSTFGVLEVREVWAIAMKVHGALPAQLANRLLNDRKKFGGWRALTTDTGDTLVYFSAQVSSDCDAQTLDSVMDLVLAVADKLEKELTGKDVY
jgi:hypothetical protein